MPRRTRLVPLLIVAVAPWLAAIGCGNAPNPTDEAVVIIPEPTAPEGSAATEGAEPAP